MRKFHSRYSLCTLPFDGCFNRLQINGFSFLEGPRCSSVPEACTDRDSCERDTHIYRRVRVLRELRIGEDSFAKTWKR
jgi:hypothetical protein